MEDKKKKIMLVSVIVLLLLVIVGSTYAYFVAQAGGDKSEKVTVRTNTTDSLTFSTGDEINIHATMENFSEGKGDLKGSTTTTATLIANNKTNEASANYNVFFIIDSNDFVHTTEDGKAEIVLKVTDPNGNEVENITGLKRVENGFDITTREGGFLITSDYVIEASPEESQTWTFEVTLVNLDSDQNKNTGKTFKGKVYITKEKLATYEPPVITNVNTDATYESIKTDLVIEEGTQEIDKYYYGIKEATATGEVEYKETSEASYTYSNLKEKTKYKIYSYAKDINGTISNVYETEITTDEYVIPVIEEVTHSKTLNSITVNVRATKGDGEIKSYYYSKDNGATYEMSTASSYTFTDLQDTTDYKIKIKVEDENERYSTEYEETITTVTYINPKVTTVESTTTYNSIKLTATATGGTNSVDKYYYSKDNGATWTSGQSTNTYTFTGLKDNTTYNIKVKVEDTNKRESNEYKLVVTTNEYVTAKIKSVTTSSTRDSITITATGENGTGTIRTYYYSKDNGSNWETSTSNTHTFSGLTSGVTFYIKVKAIDSNNKETNIYETSETTLVVSMSDFIKSQYTSQGANGLYKHDSTLANSAEDGNLRYAGADPNNYVCFGSDASTCSNDNLYRIIGVFGDQVKLIKYDYATKEQLGTDGDYTPYLYYKSSESTYRGNSTSINRYYFNYKANNRASNNWETSLLNKTNLNTNYINYLNNINPKWVNMIADTKWNVGGNTTGEKAKKYCNTEKTKQTTKTSKIGLMYVSDYGFATSDSNWKYELSGYHVATIKDNNWMYMGLDEWTITPNLNDSENELLINTRGSVGCDGPSGYAIRPVFYLKSDVIFSSGTGAKSNPYRLAI